MLAVVVLAALLGVSACAAPSPTIGPSRIVGPSQVVALSPGPAATPTPSPIPSPVVMCGDLAAADCPAATSAALTLANGRNGVVVQVELGRGVWCPTPGLLFANMSCPGGSLPPPEGGQWIGHALVTFAGSAAQAYINIARNGPTVRGEFIALATPPPVTPSPS